MKFLRSNGVDPSLKNKLKNFLSCKKTIKFLKIQWTFSKELPSMIYQSIRSINFIGLLLLLVTGFILGVMWDSKKVEEADRLSEQSAEHYVLADQYKDKAKKQSYETASLEKKVAAKDREVEYWKTQSVNVKDLLELTKQQNESILLRDEVIRSLKIENKELKRSLDEMEMAYRVQVDASEAYRDAIKQEKLTSMGWGALIGGIAVAILKR